MIAPEVAGRVAAIPFKEGERVAAGDVIVKLDDALAQAELAEAQARYDFAKANLDRANALARTGNVTERSREEAVSEFGIARAALELARVRLAKHTITAPFAGVIGLRNTSVGAFLAIGTEVVNIEKIDPLKVDFSIPEVFLTDVRVGQHVDVTVDAIPNRSFSGTITAVDPMVDVNGRSLKIRARLPNSEGVLRPGLFARLTIKGLTEQEVVIVPEGAVVPRGGDSFVYRVEDGKAVESKVRLGERGNGEVAVLDGLLANTVVVTAGHQRLRNGTPVEVVARGKASAEGRAGG
jgi:membrane fusion protein, multidrug efflux system